MTPTTLKTILTDLGFECRSYSGRGMFGKECVAVEVEHHINLAAELAEYMAESYEMEFAVGSQVSKILVPALRNMCTDSLGRGYVVYFPKVPFTEEGA